MYALWLDEFDGPRQQARERLDDVLCEPFEREDAVEYRRERFGMTGEDLRDRMKSEAFWGDGL